ncbi:hypothetical protein [Agrobacterium cavarae]|uniref:hypothetical protein n=1 Tax=Agrobacterium cavarae TaxID=2528239 RepID=UPI003D00FDE8
MTLLRLMQPAFTGGELSPALYARVDTSKYQSGLKTAKNIFVHPHGGASNRSGLEFIGRTRGSSFAVLLPFVFDAETDQTYNLEFSHLKMRVYRAGVAVLEASKAITAISIASPAVLTSAGHGYADGEEIFISGISGPTGLNGRNFLVRNVTANTFRLEDLNGVAVSTLGMPAYAGGGTARRVYEIASPYTADELRRLVFAQENDVMYLTHQAHPPMKLSRFSDANWTFEVLTFAPKMAKPAGLTGTVYFKRKAGDVANIAYRVSALSASGAESVPAAAVTVAVQYQNEDGRRVRLTWNAMPNATLYRIYRSDANTGILAETAKNEIEIDQTQYVADGSAIPSTAAPGAPATPTGVTGSIVFGKEMKYVVAAISDDTGEESLPSDPVTLRNDMAYRGNRNVLFWTATPGAGSYAVYRFDNGRYGYVGKTETPTFTDENITPDLASGPQEGNNPFDSAGNYPACVNFYEQRLAMAGTQNVPAGLWLGQSANYENFGAASPIKASDAITIRLRSKEKNQIRAISEARGMAVFTSANEFNVSGGAEDFLTPTNTVVKKQSNRGSSWLQPIAVGDVMLFALARGGVIRDYSYEFANDNFSGRDLTIMSRHLFEGRKVLSWAYAQSPYSIVWVVLDNGMCVSLTYMREQEVWAWTRHETDGVFEAVNVVAEGDEDAVYFVVRRTVAGQQQRYIERMHSRLFDVSEDAFFVDSGLSYEGPATKTIRGLYHLEGRTLVALADGNVVRDLVVTGGAVTLPISAKKVHVGLPYEAEIKTLDIDMGSVQGLGTVQARNITVANITLRVEKTRGIWAGPSDEALVELKQREFENWNEATRLATDDVELTPTADWTKGGTMIVKQFDPLPMTILAIMPDVKVAS